MHIYKINQESAYLNEAVYLLLIFWRKGGIKAVKKNFI